VWELWVVVTERVEVFGRERQGYMPSVWKGNAVKQDGCKTAAVYRCASIDNVGGITCKR